MKRGLKTLLAILLISSLVTPSAVYAAQPEESETASEPENITEAYAIEKPPVFELPSDEEDMQAAAFAADEVYDETELLFELESKVKEAVLKQQSSVDLSDMQINRQQYAIADLLYFSPYFSNGIDLVFWYRGSYYSNIAITNTMTQEETEAYFRKVDEKVSEMKRLVSEDMSEERKALVIHDYFVYEYEYDYENLLNGTLPNDSYRSGGLFLKGTGVCQAYAYGYKYIMNLLGIECHVTASSGMGHAWNIIKIDGSYYHVDCTWDDPVPDSLGKVYHAYFLVSDSAIQEARLGTSVHYGWDLTELVCDSKTYDDAYWVNTRSQIIIEDDYAYYIEGTSIYKRNLRDQSITTLKNLGRWNVWGSSGSYWVGAFSGLFLHNHELYYNTATEIRKITLDGQEDSLVYKPDTSNGYIYASAKHGDTLQYVLKQSPNESADSITAPVDLTVKPTDIVIRDNVLQMEVGDTRTIYYTVIPAAASSKVNWNSDNSEVASVNERGEVSAVGVGNATITVTTSNGKTASCNVTVLEKLPFADVMRDQWYYGSVRYAYQNYIMTGLSEKIFGTNAALSRAQFAVILYRMNGVSKVEFRHEFQDVEENIWYTDAVLWANSIGVVTGYSNGNFGPADNISREQMAVMMYRYAGKKGYDTSEAIELGKFQDASKVSEFAKEAMRWAVGSGILTGKSDGTQLDPQGNAIRVECAAIIQRFMEKYK